MNRPCPHYSLFIYQNTKATSINSNSHACVLCIVQITNYLPHDILTYNIAIDFQFSYLWGFRYLLIHPAFNLDFTKNQPLAVQPKRKHTFPYTYIFFTKYNVITRLPERVQSSVYFLAQIHFKQPRPPIK